MIAGQFGVERGRYHVALPDGDYPTDVAAGYFAGTIWVIAVLFAAGIRRPVPKSA